MIETLARKRTNVVAVAALIALVAAMFTAFAPSSAQAAGISLGACVAWDATAPRTTMNYIAIGDSCTVTDLAANTADDGAASNADVGASSNPAVVAAPVADGTAADTDTTNDDLTAISIGVTEVTVNRDGSTPAGVETYRITVIAEPTVIVHIGDTDNIVSKLAPAPSVSVIARGFADGQVPTAGTGITVSTSGIYFSPAADNTTSFISGVNAVVTTDGGGATIPGAGSNVTGRTYGATLGLVITAAQDGDYTLTATVPEAAAAVEPETVARKAKSGTATLTIGNPGASPASVNLALAPTTPDNPTTLDDETVPGTGRTHQNGSITLGYGVLNSLGNDANAGDLTAVTVVAPSGTVAAVTGTTLGQTSPSVKGAFTVSSIDGKPRTIDVYVYATGTAGLAQSDVVTVTFTGAADGITLGDASGTMLNVSTPPADVDDGDNRDVIGFGFSTVDGSGNAIQNPVGLAITIVGPDGKSVGTTRIARDQVDAPGSRSGAEDLITLASLGTRAKPLASGEYTVTIKRGTLTAESTFVVAGKAADIAVSVDNMSPTDFGEIIKVTATVTDSDGSPAADGTAVTFKASSGSGTPVLIRVGTGGAIPTKGGEASASFSAVGAGLVAITADADDATGVVVVNSTAGATDAAADEEVSLDCLSSHQGFSTYTCSMDSSASELFALVAGRGATAIQLWSGSMWVRYSVIDGAEIPGSSDFLVTEDDILYISN